MMFSDLLEMDSTITKSDLERYHKVEQSTKGPAFQYRTTIADLDSWKKVSRAIKCYEAVQEGRRQTEEKKAIPEDLRSLYDQVAELVSSLRPDISDSGVHKATMSVLEIFKGLVDAVVVRTKEGQK